MRLKFFTLCIAVLAAAAVWQVGAAQDPGAKQRDPLAPGPLKHGEYLVNRAVLCGDCHTPQDDRGRPDRSREAPLIGRPQGTGRVRTVVDREATRQG